MVTNEIDASSVAQMVEQMAADFRVFSSNPTKVPMERALISQSNTWQFYFIFLGYPIFQGVSYILPRLLLYSSFTLTPRRGPHITIFLLACDIVVHRWLNS